MATDYSEDGSRVGLDGGSISWQAACETSVTDWVKTNQVIFSAHANSSSHTPASESFRLQWRNVSDSGTFADLVTGSGELRAGVSAGAITNTDPIGSGDGCGTGTPALGEEVENESPLQTASLQQPAKNNSLEMQWCVDFSNALDSKEYAFQLYSVTGVEALGQCAATITIEAGAAPIPKGVVDTVDGADVFAKIITFQTKAFVDAIGGADVFEILYRAMGFADVIAGADVFTNAIILQSKAFVDTVAGSDAFTLLRFLDFVDAIAGADVWSLTKPMDFVDTISGADVFTKATILQLKDFADTIAGADVFTIPFRAMGFVDSISGSDVFDVTLFKAFSDAIGGIDVWTLTRPMYFSDSATGTDVFVTPYKEMGFEDTLSGSDIFELLRFLAFTDTVTGSDVFTLLRELGFADTVGGADVFSIPYREMGFSDTIGGVDVFTQPYREMEFVDTLLGTDVFTQGIVGGIIEKFIVDTGYGLETFSHIQIMDFADAGAGVDVFLVTKPEIIIKITDGELYQILITDGPLNQVKITWGDI